MERVVMLAALLAGCVDLEPVSEVATPIVVPCPTCLNSPVIDSYHFHELNRVGLYNAQGLRIIAFELGGKPLRLDVQKGRLIGSDATGAKTGTALRDAVLWIADMKGQVFAVKVQDVGTTQYWAALHG